MTHAAPSIDSQRGFPTSPRVGTVNYHVHRPHRQAFEIDAGGVVGKLVVPELRATEVQVNDARRGEAAVRFADDGVAFANSPTDVASFLGDDTWKLVYERELDDLLVRNIGAAEVVIFDHTVRVDDPDSTRQPARNVHTDYSPEGAHNRLRDVLGEAKAREWSRGRYAFVNVWRPIGAPVNSSPLGFVRPSSVHEDDWVLLDLKYPDRLGHIMGLTATPRHEWIYLSRMTPDEVAVFNIYDNGGAPSVAHGAIDLTEDEGVQTIRRSIESRTIVRYTSDFVEAGDVRA